MEYNIVMKWHAGLQLSSLATINHQLEFALSILYMFFSLCLSQYDLNVVHGGEDLPASLVLTPLEGALGSPVPMALLATTLNSYSTQGLSSTAMADSMSPVTGSGSAYKSVALCIYLFRTNAT